MSNKGKYRENATGDEQDCEIVLKNTSVYIYPAKEKKGLLIWSLRELGACSYDGNTLKLEKGKQPSRTLVCGGDIAREIYAIYTSAPDTKKKESRPLVSYSPFIIFCLGIGGIGLLVYFLFLPWLGRQLVSYIPVSMEIELGEALGKQYSVQYKSKDSANIYANRFWNELHLPGEYPIHIEVLQSEELNAFALPGGRIYIYTGMLEKLGSYEELVALLGHEVSHVTKRHSLKSILRQAATGIIVSAMFGDISEISGWVLSRADEFKQLDYSRELETEADDEGYALMLRAQVNPSGMLKLLGILKKEGERMPALMKYLSTHPDTDARIENVKSKQGINNTYAKNEKLEQLFMRLKRQCN